MSGDCYKVHINCTGKLERRYEKDAGVNSLKEKLRPTHFKSYRYSEWNVKKQRQEKELKTRWIKSIALKFFSASY